MIIVINGWPGVGKLTVGRILAQALGGRLLDNHTIYNVAFSLTQFRTPEFYEAVRGVREVAFATVARLPAPEPVIMTVCYAQDSAWGNENWDAIIALARKSGRKLLAVTLDCAAAENIRRVQIAERANLRKLTDGEELVKIREGRALLERDVDAILRIDNTLLPPEDCAARIIAAVSG